MSSRRVSLPVSLGVQRLSILRPAPIPTSRLSPASPRSPCGRRSLPTTPGGRRSLPGTPRNLSPRPHILPDLDEYLPTTPSTSSSSETSPRRLNKRHRTHRNQFSLRDSGFMEANNNSCIKEDEGLPRSERSDGQLRSFDYKHGSVVDNGYQNKGIMKYVQKKRGESRRATCPEIWLFPETSNPARKVVLRIYGSKNTGKKTLAHQIYHLASTTAPEQIHVLFRESELTQTNTAHFLLNGDEIELEILLESMLESSPFNANITIYIVVYTVDNRESFIKASDLLYRIHQIRKKTAAHVVLVGNKIDLKRHKVVSAIEGKALAKTYRCSFVEVSALLSVNIDIMWIQLIKQLKEPAELTSWMGKVVNRGHSIAKSCEELVQRLIS